MAFFAIVRGSIGWIRRLACFNTGLTWTIDTFSRNRASQEFDGHRQEWFPGMNGLSARGAQAACCFKMIGVETCLLPPNDQHDRGNLSRQGQARHRAITLTAAASTPAPNTFSDWRRPRC